ncbi:MAG: S8 family serine peptidase [Thermoanaerobaculia bacterium]|nr:S8 family serine peptidase [Thermoanaerobaculia bacterium]
MFRYRSVLGVVFSLLSVPLLAQPMGGRFVVEFREPPLARASANRTASSYAGTFAQFRDDLGRIEPAAPGTTSAAAIDFEYFRAFHGASVRLARRSSLAELRALPYVRAIHPDVEVTAFSSKDDAPGSADALVPAATGGSGIVIAVIDSGIDASHPAFAGRIAGGYDFVNGDGDPDDDFRHGTHVAGIVAANGGGLTGVAPEASLLVYKVLDDNGRGKTSAILAALERAIDPNLDGDLSDRAHVINLSLGGPGSPDDPLSRAVDNATAAGSVVVAAAGNTGLFHSVGSPAAARTAIAVGAHDGDGLLAEFSSRGPATVSGAVKPEVLAPGVEIRSAAPGGGTRVSSGTSMASPHVAGIVALLREQHPDWSPQRVRSAIVSSAVPIANEEVMSQGTGRVDATRAAGSSLSVSPSTLELDLDATAGASYASQRELTITNDDATTRSFRLRAVGLAPAITIGFEPAELDLAPGASRAVSVTVEADNAALGDPQSASFAFGGLIEIESGGTTSRVPWAFLRAGRARVRYDLEFPGVYWTANEPRAASFAIVDANTTETLLAPGTYDLTLVSSWDGDLRVITREQVAIDGDRLLTFSAADARHAVTLSAVDAQGSTLPLVEDELHLWFPQLRVLFPEGSPLRSLELPRPAGRTLHVSMESSRWGLLASESYLDGEASRFVVVQHPVLRGIDGDRVVTGGGETLRAKQLRLRFPPDATRREIGILARGVTRNPVEIGRAPLGVYVRNQPAEWIGTLWMTPEVHPDYGSALQVFAYTQHAELQGLAANITTPIRLRESEFFSTRSFDPAPVPSGAPGAESLVFGDGPSFPLAILGESSGFLTGQLDVAGDRNDLRRLSRSTVDFVVRRSGVETARGTIGAAQPIIPLGPDGAFDVAFGAATTLAGSAARTTLWLGFDTRRPDSAPPALTSLALLDALGRHTSSLPLFGTGSLVLSAGDYEPAYEGPQYRQGSLQIRSVFFRRTGTLTWAQLPTETLGEDAGAGAARTPAGVIFRADLTDALIREGRVDLRIELTDAAGNAAVTTIEPAFVVEKARRRGSRRE